MTVEVIKTKSIFLHHKLTVLTWPCCSVWLECDPIYQKVASSISGQGTYVDYRFDAGLGDLWWQSIDVSLSLLCLYE